MQLARLARRFRFFDRTLPATHSQTLDKVVEPEMLHQSPSKHVLTWTCQKPPKAPTIPPLTHPSKSWQKCQHNIPNAAKILLLLYSFLLSLLYLPTFAPKTLNILHPNPSQQHTNSTLLFRDLCHLNLLLAIAAEVRHVASPCRIAHQRVEDQLQIGISNRARVAVFASRLVEVLCFLVSKGNIDIDLHLWFI